MAPGFSGCAGTASFARTADFPPAVIWLFGSAGILPLRYSSVQEVRQRPIKMRPTQLSLGVGGHDGANQLDETGTNAHKQSYEVQRARV